MSATSHRPWEVMGRAASHDVAYASCSCGWSAVRRDEPQARSAAHTHALSHKTWGQPCILPPAPIRPWSAVEAES